MRIFKSSIAAISIALMAALIPSANASLLIEPHLGYIVSGKTTFQNNEWKYTGPQYGARLGVQYLGVMGGLAYTHSSYDLKVGGAKEKTKQDEIGLFVGYNAPILLRAWVGYFPSAKAKLDSGSEFKGNTTELGLGFTALPFVSINLSYRMLSFDEVTASGLTGTLNPEYDPKEIVLGVSLPFNL